MSGWLPWRRERQRVEEAEQVVAEEKRADDQHREALRMQQDDLQRRLQYLAAQAAVTRRGGM